MTNLSLIQQVHILTETLNFGVTFFLSSLDVGHALISLLFSNDLIPQYGCEGDVVERQIR
jgi:hypothetical protein